MNDAANRAGAGAAATDAEWLARARALGPLIADASAATEEARQVTDEVMAALHEAALFRMFLPCSLRGGEATPMALVEVLEAVAAADASTAWCLGQAHGCTLAAAFIDAGAAGDVFGADDAVLAWGPPSGGAKAVATDGGYRVSGEWMFASGSRHASWLGAHCPVVTEAGEPVAGAGGRPLVRTMLFPKASATMKDVWQVMGLRGTGSDNYTVADLFVPEAYSYRRDHPDDRREAAPIYRVPLLTFYGMAFAGVALGIARASLDAFIDLAAKKKPHAAATLLRDNAVVQSDVAQAEARLGSARAYLMQMIREFWETACANEPFPLDQRARLRASITWAMNQARKVNEFAYLAAGATAIFEANAFERRFRDMHAVSQQGQAHLSNFESAGQALLGLTPSGHRV